ncbi:MAG: Ribonuclease [Actinomycetota bacterium]|jgi:ribonuclease P protein component
MLPDSSIPTPRIAFAIGRSAGTAVTRNRIRRRLREAVRHSSLVPGLYLFGVTRDATREPSFTEVTEAVSHISARAREVAA